MIKNISVEQYEKLAYEYGQDHFLHSLNWAKTRESINWSYEILGYEEDGLKVAAIITYKKFPYINKYYAYVCRGFVIDYLDDKLLAKWTEELKEYLKYKKVVTLTIDPDIVLNVLDNDYKVVEHFDDTDKIMNTLSNLNYKHQGFLNNFEGIQPRHTFRIDIKNYSKEELFKRMGSSTRYSINLVSKSSLDVTYGDISMLDDFVSLMDETTKRDNFTSRDKVYYENIMKEFKDDVKLIFVSISPNKVYRTHEEEVGNIKQEIEQLMDGKSFEELGKKAKSKINEYKKQENKIEEKLNKLKPYLQHDKLNLAVAFLITHNKKAWYVYGASSDLLREYRPTYLIYKTMIDYCYDNDFEFLDLFGVGGELNPDSEIHGLYVMKKGFGGDLIEFVGEYDLVIDKFYYSLYKVIFPKVKKMRKKLKK